MNHTLHYEFNSCPSQMSGVRERIRISARAAHFSEEIIGQIVLAVDEACTNIIRHAYDGMTTCKIEMDIFENDEHWEIRLRDYGKKCDPSKLKGRNLEDIRPGGLGLFFIRSAFDHVDFDHSPEVGTCLLLRKNKTRTS